MNGGAIPPDFCHRVLIDVRYDRTELIGTELQVQGAGADTQRLIQEHAAPLDWPSEPRAIVWCYFWLFLKGYAGAEKNEVVVKTLSAIYAALPTNGIFVILDHREDLESLQGSIAALAIPFRSLDIFHPIRDPKDGALVYRK